MALHNDGLRQLIAALPQFAFVLDRTLRVVLANRSVGKRTPQQLEGLTITDFFPEHLHPAALASLHRVLATGQVDGFSAEIEGLTRESRHFDIRVTPIRDGEAVVALTLIASETTEQVRAERAIATQARMIESMLEGVAVINDVGVIEITNPAFDALFGYRRGELIGRDMAALAGWPFEQPERWRIDAGEAGGSLRVEFEGRRADASHFAAQGVLSRFEVAGRNHSLVVLQDVSERKHLERSILEAVNREQYRIGNDLHDGLGQELTGIALMLRGVAGRLTAEYPPILPEVESIMRLVNNAIESTRALARGLLAREPGARGPQGRAGRPRDARLGAVRSACCLYLAWDERRPAQSGACEPSVSHRSGRRAQRGPPWACAVYTAALAQLAR